MHRCERGNGSVSVGQLEAVEDRVLHLLSLPADRLATPCCGRPRLSGLRRHFFPPPLLAPDASPICPCSHPCFLIRLAFALLFAVLCLAFVLLLFLFLFLFLMVL